MPENDGQVRRWHPGLDLIEVRVADAADGDAEADLARSRLRDGEVGELERGWVVLQAAELWEDHGAHGELH
jgi:hypothetical protein